MEAMTHDHKGDGIYNDEFIHSECNYARRRATLRVLGDREPPATDDSSICEDGETEDEVMALEEAAFVSTVQGAISEEGEALDGEHEVEPVEEADVMAAEGAPVAITVRAPICKEGVTVTEEEEDVVPDELVIAQFVDASTCHGALNLKATPVVHHLNCLPVAFANIPGTPQRNGPRASKRRLVDSATRSSCVREGL